MTQFSDYGQFRNLWRGEYTSQKRSPFSRRKSDPYGNQVRNLVQPTSQTNTYTAAQPRSSAPTYASNNWSPGAYNQSGGNDYSVYNPPTPPPTTGGGYPTPEPPTGGGYPTPEPPTGGGYPTPEPPTGGGYPTPEPPTGGGYPTDPPTGGGYPTPSEPPPTTGGPLPLPDPPPPQPPTQYPNWNAAWGDPNEWMQKYDYLTSPQKYAERIKSLNPAQFAKDQQSLRDVYIGQAQGQRDKDITGLIDPNDVWLPTAEFEWAKGALDGRARELGYGPDHPYWQESANFLNQPNEKAGANYRNPEALRVAQLRPYSGGNPLQFWEMVTKYRDPAIYEAKYKAALADQGLKESRPDLYAETEAALAAMYNGKNASAMQAARDKFDAQKGDLSQAELNPYVNRWWQDTGNYWNQMVALGKYDKGEYENTLRVLDPNYRAITGGAPWSWSDMGVTYDSIANDPWFWMTQPPGAAQPIQPPSQGTPYGYN